MRNTQKLEQARQRLTAAIEPSQAGAADAAEQEVRLAEYRLLRGGREDLAYRLADALDDGAASPAARREIREVAAKIDAELSPAVAAEPFSLASDGGER